MKKIRFSVFLFCLVVTAGLTWAGSGFALVQATEQVNQIPEPQVSDIGIMKAPSSLSFAFVGNSFFYFNNGITSYFGPMVTEGFPKLKRSASLITISGSALDWHDVESYLRPNGIGKYSFDSANNVVFNEPKQKLFDVLIMIDSSQGPIHPQLKSVFAENAQKDCDIIRRHGTIPVLFMTWAYADRPEMTEQLAIAYTQVGNANNAMVIPGGLAFARSIAERPDINLYASDKRHPSLAGTYLSAATVYAAIFKKSPIGLKYNGGLDDSVARHLQKIAWDTCQAYYGQK
jgi:hypothetical protein